MLERRRRLGYVEVVLREPALWGKEGDRLRGHAFHYSELVSDPTACDGWSAAYSLDTRRGPLKEPEGFFLSQKRILASYVHLHLTSRPAALDRFLRICVQARAEGRPPRAKTIKTMLNDG